MRVCMCAYVCMWQRERWVHFLDPVELEFQEIVSPIIGAGKWTPFLCKSSQVFLTTEPLLCNIIPSMSGDCIIMLFTNSV